MVHSGMWHETNGIQPATEENVAATGKGFQWVGILLSSVCVLQNWEWETIKDLAFI